MLSAPPPSSSAPPMAAGDGQEEGASLIQVQDGSEYKKNGDREVLSLEEVLGNSALEGEREVLPVQPEEGPKETKTMVGGSKGSWIGAVQGQKVMRKYEVEVMMKDGIGTVLVPPEITKDVPPLWDDFLVGKFLDEAPHIAKIHAIVNKIWNLNDRAQKIDVYEVNQTTMKFRIPNQADMTRIVRRGMWNLAGIPVIMTKWSPMVEKGKPNT